MSILTVCVVVRAASRLLVSASEVVEDDSTSEDCSSVVAEDMVMPNVTVLCWCQLSVLLSAELGNTGGCCYHRSWSCD